MKYSKLWKFLEYKVSLFLYSIPALRFDHKTEMNLSVFEVPQGCSLHCTKSIHPVTKTESLQPNTPSHHPFLSAQESPSSTNPNPKYSS
jgi:hypothetical protein